MGLVAVIGTDWRWFRKTNYKAVAIVYQRTDESFR